MIKNIYLTILIFTLTVCAKGQPVFEHTYTIPAGGTTVFLTNLGNENYKYVMLDYYGNKFSLFNIDHTPFITNIPLPLPSDSFALYQVGYITSSLFDCDSTNVEYALMTQTPNPNEKFMIYRTDGTQIFSKDSVTVQYCFGCSVGSVNFEGITNTPAGAKLFLQNPNREVSIYALCGILPEEIKELNNEIIYVQVTPNPASSNVLFNIKPPNNYEQFQLTIFDLAFHILQTSTVSGESKQIMFDAQMISSGTYFFSLESGRKIIQTGKFIISK